MTAAQNITAWFTDAATRHPDIRHGDGGAVRFFELEWDELIQNGGMQALTHWTLVLEDYDESMEDSGADYYARRPHLAFMVVKTVPQGDLPGKKQAYIDAQRIAEQVLAKLFTDTDTGPCTADVPAGVRVPVKVLIDTVKGTRVGPVPAFDHAFGYRISVDVRMDGDVDLDSSHTAWLPLP